MAKYKVKFQLANLMSTFFKRNIKKYIFHKQLKKTSEKVALSKCFWLKKCAIFLQSTYCFGVQEVKWVVGILNRKFGCTKHDPEKKENKKFVTCPCMFQSWVCFISLNRLFGSIWTHDLCKLVLNILQHRWCSRTSLHGKKKKRTVNVTRCCTLFLICFCTVSVHSDQFNLISNDTQLVSCPWS